MAHTAGIIVLTSQRRICIGTYRRTLIQRPSRPCRGGKCYDPKLQSLIETGLERNTDLNVARLRVEATEAVLMTARLSYLPSLGLTAEGNANKHDGATAKTYNVGASASWELDIFGKTYGRQSVVQPPRYKEAVPTGRPYRHSLSPLLQTVTTPLPCLTHKWQ